MPDRNSNSSQRTHEILRALDESSPATTAELATALDTHPVTIERDCRALQREGYIRLCGGGTYTLAEPLERSTVATTIETTAEQHRTTTPAD